ncbi:MAG: hypothetical protein ACYTF1_07735 [Planctomycetota bacterium]|jgi:hypothetical protein
MRGLKNSSLTGGSWVISKQLIYRHLYALRVLPALGSNLDPPGMGKHTYNGVARREAGGSPLATVGRGRTVIQNKNPCAKRTQRLSSRLPGYGTLRRDERLQAS